MTDQNRRNTTLDAIKTIAALSVVFLHYNHVNGELGNLYTRIVFNLTIFAVPFFFMTTGYFLVPLIERQRHKAYLKKILIMALCSTLFYFVYYFTVSPDNIEWVKAHYTPGTVIMWLSGQDDPAAFHLWYFYCLIWSVIISFFILTFLNRYVLYAIAVVVVIYRFLGIDWLYCYTQSLPAIALGVFLYHIRAKVSWFSHTPLFGCVILMLLVMIGEALYNKTTPGSYYEGHILALIIFIWGLCHPKVTGIGRLEEIGLKYSALIYIFHVFVNDVMSRIISYDSVLLQVIRPWLVFGISLLLSMMVVRIKNRIREKGLLSWSI